jgi:hypothetical protein
MQNHSIRVIRLIGVAAVSWQRTNRIPQKSMWVPSPGHPNRLVQKNGQAA